MYLGYQKNKAKFYTEQPLDMEMYNLDLIEEVQDEYVLEGDQYVIKDSAYEERERAREQDRIDHLTMTALDLITAVKTLGLSDEQVEAYLNQNLNIKHQLMFCQNVYCGVVKQLCPIDIGEVRLDVAEIEALFKAKHGIQ